MWLQRGCYIQVHQNKSTNKPGWTDILENAAKSCHKWERGHLVAIKFQLHKEDRLTPSCETALIGLANKAYSGKIFCACTSGFELPDNDMVISILYSWKQENFSICNKQISRISVINHKIHSSNKLNNFLGLLQPVYHLVFVIDKWQPCNY